MEAGWCWLSLSIISSSGVFCQPLETLVGAWGPGELSDSHEARQGLLSPHQEKHEAALPEDPWCGSGITAPLKGG